MIDGSVLLVLTSFAFGAASALIWVLNVEAYVLAVCATAATPVAIAAAVAMTLGVTVGKVVLYLIARHGPDAVRRYRRYRDAADVAEASIGPDDARGVRTPAPVGAGAFGSGATAPPAVPTPVGGVAVPAPRRRRWTFTWTYAWLPAPVLRWLRAIGAWGTRLLRTLDQPGRAFVVVFASATLGVPPLAATTIAAGLRRTSIPSFVAGVLLGRTIRFAVLAVPALLASR
jgi:membrane protein YqaA with SNARE-associated domain